MLMTQASRTGWDPFADLWRRPPYAGRPLDTHAPGRAPRHYPAVNIWLGDNSVVVTAELPGLSAKDVEVTVREDALTVSGEHREPSGKEGLEWHRRERPAGAFSRTIDLPFRVDPDRVQARIQNGVLEVEMERPEADRPRKVEIRNN